MPVRPSLVRSLAGALMAAVLLTAGMPTASGGTAGPRPYRILPAEFEPQDAVLLGWDRENVPIQRALLRIVGAIRNTVQVVMLVRGPEDRVSIAAALHGAGLPPEAVRYLQMPYDTIWARDYGPAVVWTIDGTLQMVDADYERGARQDDDDVPARMAPQFLLPAVHAPLTIEGGNLLSNGVGLCVTTLRTIEQNAERGYAQADLDRLIRESYGASDVVFLEPLSGEPTGHADMFCTFTAADTVLVGRIAPELDPINAAILDRNARRLAGRPTPQGPLKVVRIPMPPCENELWRTYTNVLYANGVVLVPTYAGADPQLEAAALEVFRRVLPGWRVVGIDCTDLITLGGAVHCVSLNLSRVGRLPENFDSHPGRGGFLLPHVIENPDGWRPADDPATRPAIPPPFLPPLVRRTAPMFRPERPEFERFPSTPFERD